MLPSKPFTPLLLIVAAAALAVAIHPLAAIAPLLLMPFDWADF